MRIFRKQSDIVSPAPAKCWVLIDESPWSINDACLGVSAAIAQIVDWPATFHNNACGFSFCDGHAEVHKWRSGHMTLNSPASTQPVSGPYADLMADWTWFSTHATIKMQ